ncbi:MAG: DUF1501 domain-containing protein [Verrucomicrobia bacterium]|nr:MAG: DUF1501 domain-containing protein [Verrucomicrobiota bacterium]
MLTFQDRFWQSGRWQRRQFLQAGALALGGLTLGDNFAIRAAAAAGENKSGKNPLKDRSVIFLFMHGGPSQFETFDPKMDAPSGIRSATGEIPTTLPGITFGSTFPRLAKLAHKFSIVRSFATGDANHDIKPILGADTLQANMGSLYSSIAGASRVDTAMPTNVALFPRSVDATAREVVKEFGNFEGTGELSRSFAPFVPGAGAALQQDMRINLPEGRFHDRRALLESLDGWRRWSDGSTAVQDFGGFQRKAFDVLHRGVFDAFDLAREDPRTVERYDTAPLLPRGRIDKKWNNIDHYATNALTLGRQLLLARRLCERGVGFVTVTTSFIWDMHADINNAPMTVGMEYVGTPFDHAVSAFIEDVEARGLSDKILLVCCGEMGRSPAINANGGRDHWGNLAPLLLYGGGLKMGQVIGESSRDGGEPATQAVTMKDLLATIMHTLLDIGQARLLPGVSQRVIEAIGRGEPIRGLV